MSKRKTCNSQIILVAIATITFPAGCIQKFLPTFSSPPTGYLVVEGIIGAGGGPAQVSLTRTTQVSDSSVSFESGASVQVEGNDSSVYRFADQGGGIYGIPN